MDAIFNERTLLLVAHIGAVILLIGPVIVATSLFPRYASPENAAVAGALHRITRVYGATSLMVPGIGVILAQRFGLLGAGWIVAALVLFTVAFGLLIGFIVPRQDRLLQTLLDRTSPPADLASLRMASGMLNLIWLVILVLMVAKPT
ncbi:MAG TPA: hypothetical protein VFQ54_13590 [Thermomicrobiales bacterium]|nr:hypothetical protein [Thermomicrobiales bacterium]